MRVIAGRFRGTRLEAPPGTNTRPITDQVKESIFNILGHKFLTPGELPAIDVLDVFAGAGSFGIEALSRGARSATFVERNGLSVRTLRHNLRRVPLDDEARILRDDAFVMRFPPAEGGSDYGLVFCDPPYRTVENGPRILDLLERIATRLAADGYMIFRHALETPFEAHRLSLLHPDDERTFGRMRVWLLKRGE